MSLQLSAVSLQRVPAIALFALCGCGEREAADSGLELTPVTIAETHASNPSVAFGADGAPIAVWVGGDSIENVWVARADSAGLAQPVRVNHVEGDAAAHGQAPPQVAAGPDGNVYVLWQNNTPRPGERFPASDLRFARSTDGGRTFEPAIYVNDDATGVSSHTFHDLAVGSDGVVYASWIDGRRDQEAGPDIRVARSTDGGRTFGASTIVSEGSCPCCRTNLAVGPDGAVYVAWRHVFEGSVRDIALARSTDGGATFDAPVRVRADNWVFDGCPHAGPAVVVAGDGSVHVAWYTGATDVTGLYHASSRDGGRTFGAPRPLTERGHVPTSQVALSATDDAVWAAWEAVGDDGARIHLARVDGEDIQAIDTGAPRGLLPSLATRGDAVALTWLDGESARALIWASGTR